MAQPRKSATLLRLSVRRCCKTGKNIRRKHPNRMLTRGRLLKSTDAVFEISAKPMPKPSPLRSRKRVDAKSDDLPNSCGVKVRVCTGLFTYFFFA